MRDHQHGWDRNWRRMEAMARRGFGRFGNFNINMNPGDWGGFGGNFRIGKMLASGDLRLVALYLIEQQPRHGYDLIKAIEEKSAGFYSPSPGIVYPALTFLEEAGYVTSSAEGNKKLYTITDEGRTHLNDNREAIESTLDFLGKAGAQMNAWREKMSSPDFPFSAEQAEKFRDMKRPGWPFGQEGHEHGHDHGAPPRPGRPDRPERPDRDMDDVAPEVNVARKALKRAIKEAVQQGPEAQARVAEILTRAAEAIRAETGDDIDLD
jgi:DNA-binding PadR family transcriptional regulator